MIDSRIAQEIFWRLHKRGCIAEKSVDQLFCERCSMYVLDAHFISHDPFHNMHCVDSICCGLHVPWFTAGSLLIALLKVHAHCVLITMPEEINATNVGN